MSTRSVDSQIPSSPDPINDQHYIIKINTLKKNRKPTSMCKILKNEIDVNIFEIAISERDDIDISKTLKSQQIVQ